LFYNIEYLEKERGVRVTMDFFTFYPSARLELLQPFGEGLSNARGSNLKIMQGGVYSIHILKADGDPCKLRMLVLLETSKEGVVGDVSTTMPIL
jgi:hypothetical protein